MMLRDEKSDALVDGDDLLESTDNPDGQEATFGEDGQMHEHFHITVEKGHGLVRIDKYLVNCLSQISRNRIQLAADAHCILVNGNPVKSNYRVKPLDEVSIVLSYPPTEFHIVPQDIPLNIVYEDDDVIVVNKQPGMVVHPGFGNWEGTLLNALAFHLQDDPKFNITDPRLGLVHRIDKDTSGLLVIAKNENAKTHLGKQFLTKRLPAAIMHWYGG